MLVLEKKKIAKFPISQNWKEKNPFSVMTMERYDLGINKIEHMSDEVTITCSRQTDEIENYQSGWELNEDSRSSLTNMTSMDDFRVVVLGCIQSTNSDVMFLD